MLKVGINWLSPYTLPTVRRLLDEGVADFCEIMVDNAVHLPAEKIRAALPGVPLALHIVTSSFLTKSPAELQSMAQHLRPWIDELQPFYVSDHLPQLDYQNDFEKTAACVCEWQALLNVKLLLENFSSMSSAGAGQAEFYERLMQETQCELLFDFSNAYIAEYNGAQAYADWLSLIEKVQNFHVAGFRIDPKTKLAIDTHDVAIDDEVMMRLRTCFSRSQDREQTIVFELDAKLDYELAKKNIAWMRSLRPGVKRSIAPLADARGSDCPLRATSGLIYPQASSGVGNQSRARQQVAPSDGVKESLISTVTEWSLRGLDHISAKGIIARSKEAPDLAIGLWKSTEPDQPAKIVTLDISAAALPPANAYAILYKTGDWSGVEWVELS